MRQRSDDFTRPKMFRDEDIQDKLKTAKKISDLKNLGPSTEAAFNKAGIKTAGQLVKLGWKKAMMKLVKQNPKNRHSILAYAIIGALTNTDWNRIPEELKLEARNLMTELKPKPKKKETQKNKKNKIPKKKLIAKKKV